MIVMKRSPLRDLIVGIFVLCGLVSIGYLSIQLGGLYYSGPAGFKLIATFDEVGDLKPRSAVVIAGVRVGQVVSIESEPGAGRRDLGCDQDGGAARRKICRSGAGRFGRNA